MVSRPYALILLIFASISLCFAQQKPETVEVTNRLMPDPALGTVKFPNSCSPAAQPAFALGVVQLHSFQYSASEQAFADAAKADPRCAMAYWGLAMTAYHPLWEGAGEKALARGRGYLEKIQSDWPATDRERE